MKHKQLTFNTSTSTITTLEGLVCTELTFELDQKIFEMTWKALESGKPLKQLFANFMRKNEA